VVKRTISIEVKDAAGAPLAGVDVRLITDPVGPVGAVAKTGDGKNGTTNGVAKLLVNAANAKAAYAAALPDHTFWPAAALDIDLADDLKIPLVCKPIAGNKQDNIDKIFGAAPADGGKGIVVAIIDGGVGPHKDIVVTQAMTLFPDENKTDDNGVGHGTHVAGIVHRLAPKAELRSYRVFRDGKDATNASIVGGAILRAVTDGADLINISIAFDQSNQALITALQVAQAKGVVCVCAAGNIAAGVQYPARLPQALAVAACSKKLWPEQALDYLLGKPPGVTVVDVHPAAFTCFGPEVTVTAPGVGIVSAFPNNRFAVMSGTSMSAPVVTGLLATALSSSNTFRNRAADPNRSVSVTKLVIDAAKLLGLAVGFEGHGVPFLQ